MYTQIALLLTIPLVLGVTLIWIGWVDTRKPSTPTPSKRRWLDKIPTSTKLLTAAGFVIGAVAASVTGWLFLALLVPALIVGVPYLLGRPEAEIHITRLNALDEWARNLSTGLQTGSGIEYAIMSTPVPEALRPELTALINRLRSNTATTDALRRLADDIDDAIGDKIVAVLLLASSLRGVGLAAILDALADDVTDMVARRRRTEAERKSMRTQARWVTIITITMISAMFLFTNFMDVYRHGLNQLLLIGLLTAFAADLGWMKLATRPPRYPRFIGTKDRIERAELAGMARP